VRIDQGNQTLPRHNLIHLDQEQLFAGLLALSAYSASAKVIFFIKKLGGWNLGNLPKSESLFQSFPSTSGFFGPPLAVLKTRVLLSV
jgi:hypothetical protein